MVKQKSSISLISSIVVIVLAVVIGVFCVGSNSAYADEAEFNDLNLALSSDQEQYGKDDVATVNLEINNNTGETHYAVSHTFTIPEGLELAQGSSISESHGDILHEDTSSGSIQLKLTSSDVSFLAQTGDGLPLVAILTIAMIACIGVAITAKRYRKQTLSVLLALGIATYGISLPNIASATESNIKHDSQSSITLNFDGVDYEVGVAVASQTKTISEAEPKPEEPETVSRDQWVSDLLGAADIEIRNDIADCPFTDIDSSPYANAIRTAWAYGAFDGLIDEDDSLFNPDKSASREFSLASAVLLLGFSDDETKLVAADANLANNPALIQIAIDTGLVSLDKSNNIRPDDNLTLQEEQEILNAIKNLKASSNNNINVESGVVYQEDVFVIPEYVMDGSNFVVDTTKYPISEDSKVAFLPTNENPKGNTGVVTAILSKNGNYITVSLEQAEGPEEVLEKISIHELATRMDVNEVNLAPGVELIDEPTTMSSRDARDISGSIKLKVPVVDGVDATVEFTPSVDIDVDWTLLEGFKKFDVTFSDEVEIGVSGDVVSVDKSVPLFATPVPIYTDGLAYVGILADVNFRADGSVSISYTMTDEIGVQYKNKHLSTHSDSTSELTAEMEASMSAGFAPYAFVSFLSIELADLQFEGGLNCKGTATNRDTGMICLDVTMSPYLKASIGKNTGWMKALHLSLEKNLIKSKDVPSWMKGNWHFEDAVRVDSCTWEQGNENPEMPEHPATGEGSGGEGIKPTLADNGYSDVPRLEDLSGSSHYYNKLVEPFNVNEGHKVVIGGANDAGLAIGYSCDPGTIFRITETDWSGNVESSDLNAFVSAGRPWYGDTVYTIEVLCGRVVVDDITAWHVPSVVLGECDTLEYPFKISDDAVKLPIDGSYTMSFENNLESIFDDKYSNKTVSWSSSDRNIVSVDENGKLKGVSKGTATITAQLGGEYGFTKTCTVTVE